jgi:hypothetical protein
LGFQSAPPLARKFAMPGSLHSFYQSLTADTSCPEIIKAAAIGICHLWCLGGCGFFIKFSRYMPVKNFLNLLF